jgi:hypothetical protein
VRHQCKSLLSSTQNNKKENKNRQEFYMQQSTYSKMKLDVSLFHCCAFAYDVLKRTYLKFRYCKSTAAELNYFLLCSLHRSMMSLFYAPVICLDGRVDYIFYYVDISIKTTQLTLDKHHLLCCHNWKICVMHHQLD